MKLFVLGVALMLIGACASHGVGCNGRLEPINAPVSTEKVPAVTP